MVEARGVVLSNHLYNLYVTEYKGSPFASFSSLNWYSARIGHVRIEE
jgi:hypothetical protein